MPPGKPGGSRKVVGTHICVPYKQPVLIAAPIEFAAAAAEAPRSGQDRSLQTSEKTGNKNSVGEGFNPPGALAMGQGSREG